jgi:hypothetical protein
MLLRVAAVAGASALTAACSSGTPPGLFVGSMVGVDGDAATDAEAMLACGGHVCGSIAVGSIGVPPDATDDGQPPYCDTHVCGSVDAAPPGDGGADADASLPCGTGVCGSIVMPQDAAPHTGDAAHD